MQPGLEVGRQLLGLAVDSSTVQAERAWKMKTGAAA